MAAEAIRRRPVGRRIGGLLLALVNLAGAVVVAFFGLIADGLRCDDNCSVAPGWRNDPSAWQWHGVLVLALVISAVRSCSPCGAIGVSQAKGESTYWTTLVWR